MGSGLVVSASLHLNLELLGFQMLLFPLKHYSNCTGNGTNVSASSFCCGLTVLFLEYNNKGRFGALAGISVRGNITGLGIYQKAMKC